MTIQLTKSTYVSGVLAAAGSQHTLDAQTESYLVHIGAATWVDAAYTQGRFEDAKIEYDSDGDATGIVGRANEVVGPVWATDDAGNVTGLVGPDGDLILQSQFPLTNYAAGSGDLLHAFTDHTLLTPVSSAVLATSTSIKFAGQNTVSMTPPSAGATCGLSISGLTARLRNKNLIVPVYINDHTQISKIHVYIAHVSLANNASYQYVPLTATELAAYNGWHLVEVTADMWTDTGTGITADGTAIAVLRIDLAAVAGQLPTVYFGPAYLNARSRANIIFTFDDGRISQLTNAYPTLEKYRIPGCAYIIPNTINNATRIGESGLETLAASGWTIANHANDTGVGTDDSYTELGLVPYVAQVEACRDWLNARGYSGEHHAYVEGKYDGTLATALQAIGIKTARTIGGNITTGVQCMHTGFGMFKAMALKGAVQLNSTNDINAVKAQVDKAIRDGCTLILTAHDIFTTQEGGAGALAWTTADFETLVAYVASKRGDGLCDTPSFKDWASRLTYMN